jgi:hypothetical protein
MKNKLFHFALPGLLFVCMAGWAAADNSSDSMPSSSEMIQDINTDAGQDFNPLQLSHISRGPECPATSGTYCDDGYNYCCQINGEWTCVVELKDCKDD